MKTGQLVRFVVALGVVTMLALAAGSARPDILSARLASTAGIDSLHVNGNQIVDTTTGAQVKFHGVNRSGSEYACIQGWGVFDGPADQASITAIKSWNVNIVRVPLNEDCWLGINQGTLPSAYYGPNGINAEVSLIWGAPGSYQATYQPGGPDADHSPAMWTSMAQTFAGDAGVIL